MDETALKIGELRREDIPAAMRLKEAAKWNQTEQDWRFLMKNGAANYAAVVGERIVGTVTDIKYQDCFHWIGMVLVDPAHRRKGIATRLMREVMDLFEGDCPFRLDATEEGKGLYTKLGFGIEQYLYRYLCRNFVKMPVHRSEITCRQITRVDLKSVSAFDSKIFGADRQEILEYLLLAKPSYAWLSETGGAIMGYCLGRPGSNCDQIGPIVATEQSIAEALLAHALHNAVSNCVIIDSYHEKRNWNGFLTSLGFQRQRPLIRMYKGQWRRTDHPEYLFAIAGPEFG